MCPSSRITLPSMRQPITPPQAAVAERVRNLEALPAPWAMDGNGEDSGTRGLRAAFACSPPAERLACRRLPLLPSHMATPLRQPSTPSAVPNASDFLELYAFERPGPAV